VAGTACTTPGGVAFATGPGGATLTGKYCLTPSTPTNLNPARNPSVGTVDVNFTEGSLLGGANVLSVEVNSASAGNGECPPQTSGVPASFEVATKVNGVLTNGVGFNLLVP
jgi:hypothetical protein